MISSILAKIKQRQKALLLLTVVFLISGAALYLLKEKPKTKKAFDEFSVRMTSVGDGLNAEKI